MRLSLLQQQKQRPAMGQRGRLARSLYSMATRQLAAAQVLPYGSGSRAARSAAAAAGEGRPSVGAATPVLQDAYRSSYSVSRSYSLSGSSGSSSSRVHSMRLAAYTSNASTQPPPDAYNSTGAAAGTPAAVPAAAYDGADAAVPTSADVQQATGQAPTAPLQSGPLPQGQSSGMLTAQQHQAPHQPTAGQPQQMQPAPHEGARVQPGQMQPGQMQPGQMQPGQMQPGQMQPRQMPGWQQQPFPQPAAPVHLAGQQPMQMAAGQQQSVPMQAMPRQQPEYMPAAPNQAVYMQQPYAAPPLGQGPTPAVQVNAMGQMPAGQAYMQAPIAESDFAEEWVNCVGLTGVVLHGPFLQQFGSTGNVKASMVLGLLARATGEAAADAPRPVLVEAWGERAQALVQQVQTGALVFLQGHLALDLRPQERSPSHGPALTVKADSWDLVTASTVPPGRALCTYKGDYDGVLAMIRGGGAGGAAGPVASAQSSYGAQQQHGYQKPNIRKEQAMQMFLQGTSIFDIAKSLNCRAGDVFPVLVDAAEAQGAGSPAWAPLLGFAKLSPPAKAVAYYNAVMQAVQQNTAPLTKDGHVRMKAVREFLLSPQCQLAQELRQQEAAAKYGVNTTYEQVRLLLAMLRANVRL